MVGGLVHGGSERRIAASPAPPFRDPERFPGSREVSEDLAGIRVGDDRPGGHRDPSIGGALPVHVLSHAVLAARRLEQVPVPEVEQCGEARAYFEDDAPAVPPVSAVGAAAGNELLPAKTDAAPTTVPGPDGDRGFIDEVHEGDVTKRRGRKPSCDLFPCGRTEPRRRSGR